MVVSNTNFPIIDPPVPNKVVKKHYNLNIGGENVIRMQFGANPQPTKGEWTINNVKIPVGSADAKGKYTSGSIEKKVLPNF